jgi:hypothetical protein
MIDKDIYSQQLPIVFRFFSAGDAWLADDFEALAMAKYRKSLAS